MVSNPIWAVLCKEIEAVVTLVEKEGATKHAFIALFLTGTQLDVFVRCVSAEDTRHSTLSLVAYKNDVLSRHCLQKIKPKMLDFKFN